jgi:hypothetical protein
MAPDAETAGKGMNPDIFWRVVGGEAILLDTASGHYFSLNPTATVIFERLASGIDADDVAEEIAAAYSIGLDTAHADITDLLNELRNADIWR